MNNYLSIRHQTRFLAAHTVILALIAIPFLFSSSGASAQAQTDSELYSALADQARETEAMARRTADGERENARRARENAENWRDSAEEARESGQEDNARSAEDRAARAENDAREADDAAKRAERRAQIAEREAQRFDERAGQEGVREAVEAHEAVLVDPNTVFHRLYIIGDADNDKELENWTADKNALQQSLEGAGSQAAGGTTKTLVTPRKEELVARLELMQGLAVPGHEVTIYYTGHGGGGPFYGGKDLENEDNEEFEEHININAGQTLSDDELATLLRGFAPGVSITLILDSCFGGGFTGGSQDIQEDNSINVIGVGTTCPSTGETLTKAAMRGIGAADYDGDGIVTAVELENFLRAEGWDIRAPADDSSDLGVREQLEVWGTDLRNWARGAKVGPPAGEDETVGDLILEPVERTSALTPGGRSQLGVVLSDSAAGDLQIDPGTKDIEVVAKDINGDVFFQGTVDTPTPNSTITIPSSVTSAAAAWRVQVAEVGGNSPWAAFYVTPMIGAVDAEISFLPDPGAPGCDCSYSGSGTVWGIGAEAVIKPDAAGRFFFSIGFSYSETDTLDVNVAPPFPGVFVSAYTLEFKQKNATLLIGYDGDVIAPFAGIQRIAGDAKLTGDDTSDAFVVDPTVFLPGDTLQIKFVNRFENDATLAVAGLHFRIPGTRISGLARWAGDSDNDQFSLQAFFGFGG